VSFSILRYYEFKFLSAIINSSGENDNNYNNNKKAAATTITTTTKTITMPMKM
jgi:hypothetical protein